MKTLDKKGFTLAELLVVLVIIGIVSAISVPSFGRYMAERRLNGAARMVMSDLMAARQRAVTQNMNVTVTFVSNYGYTITGDPAARDIRTEYYDVTLAASANPTCYPRGNAFGTTVTVTSAGTGASRCVRLASSGRVKIDDCP